MKVSPSSIKRRLGEGTALRIAVMLISLSVAAACGDDPLPGEPSPTVDAAVFEIHLLDPLGISAMDSVGLALLETKSLLFVDGGLTDALGFLRLDGLAAGEYIPVVYGGRADLLPLPQPNWPLAIGDTVRVELRAAWLEPEEPQVAGVVVDAESGEAIGGAVVEVGTFHVGPELRGFTTRHRQVTDAEGRFALRDIIIIKSTEDGSTYVSDLLCQAAGYEGLRRPIEYEELPLLQLRLELAASGDSNCVGGGCADSASLRGRVVDFAGRPLAGVPIALEWASTFFKGADAPRPSNLLLQGVTTVSGADGRYFFDRIPAGFYLVYPGYGPRDGWLPVDGSGLPEYLSRPRIVIEAGEQAELADIPAVAALRPLQPAPDAVVGSRPDFAWERWAFIDGEWATGYVLLIAPAGAGGPGDWIAEGPFFQPSTPWPRSPAFLREGTHYWRIQAYGGLASGYPLFENWSRFTVESAETPVSDPKSPDPNLPRLETFPPVTPSGARASEFPDGR